MKLIAGSRISSIIVRAPRGVNLTISGRDVKLGLKVAIGLLVLGSICWDGQFYLRRWKIRGSLRVSTEFPPEKWSNPKNWNIVISWLRFAFSSWNFAEICTFGTSVFLYDFFLCVCKCILRSRRGFLQTKPTKFPL